jgi:hypothetical protein
VVAVLVLVATGVNADGHREILGVDVTSAEALECARGVRRADQPSADRFSRTLMPAIAHHRKSDGPPDDLIPAAA